jgi:hypothetical protein
MVRSFQRDTRVIAATGTLVEGISRSRNHRSIVLASFHCVEKMLQPFIMLGDEDVPLLKGRQEHKRKERKRFADLDFNERPCSRSRSQGDNRFLQPRL